MSQRTNNQCMRLAIADARKGIYLRDGGPFGCCIYDMEKNQVASVSHNTVISSGCPVNHAEINAIYHASKAKVCFRCCVLYTTSYPCPMCMGAIRWAKIPMVYFAAPVEMAQEFGFIDEVSPCPGVSTIQLRSFTEKAYQLFKTWKRLKGELY